MGQKLTIEYIREDFENDSYDLLTKIYINSKQKLEYICPNGHRHSICWNNWQQGQRCPTCFINSMKNEIEFIRKSFEVDNYELLTKVYINSQQKLEYICSEGHRHFMTWNNWRQGRRCPTCYNNTEKWTLYPIKKFFEKDKYNLITKVYKDAHQKLEYICPEGHKHSMSWNKWQQGRRCPTCAVINNSGCNSATWKGGISKEPYCQDWSKDLKEFVKERDGYKCMNPDCWGKDRILSVHHIDYNKKSCGAENLITVCRSCNGRANKDRTWHEAWYKAILYRRYNYIY